MVKPEQPWHVGVVIPARNEEESLGACLSALERAVDEVTQVRPGTLVRVYVVLDSCTDGSANIVAAHPNVRAIASFVGRVGMARAIGVNQFAHDVGEHARAWVANTDADSTVPRDWLVAHLDAADAGHAMLVGMIAVDRAGATPELLAAIGPELLVDDGHDHIYGANIGITLEAYRFIGGFANVPAHEDVGLVARARERGLAVLASARPAVVTSPRLRARAPEGFACYLRSMLEPAQVTP